MGKNINHSSPRERQPARREEGDSTKTRHAEGVIRKQRGDPGDRHSMSPLNSERRPRREKEDQKVMSIKNGSLLKCKNGLTIANKVHGGVCRLGFPLGGGGGRGAKRRNRMTPTEQMATLNFGKDAAKCKRKGTDLWWGAMTGLGKWGKRVGREDFQNAETKGILGR